MLTSPAHAWLLLDYGETISTAHDDAAMRQLADLTGQEITEFRQRYWALRPDYDLGQPADMYWSRVLRRAPSDVGALVQTLTTIDIDGWLHLNPHTLHTVLTHADRTGARLAVMSNAPEALAEAIDRSVWARDFQRLFYSCRLGHLKPNPKAFTVVLDELGADPAEVLFVDDRVENTQAADRLGMATITFTSAKALARALDAGLR